MTDFDFTGIEDTETEQPTVPDAPVEGGGVSGEFDFTGIPDSRSPHLETLWNANTGQDPKSHGEILRLSRESGLPPKVAELQKEKVSRDLERPDFERFEQLAPKTAQTLSNDPDLFSVAGNSVPALQKFEQMYLSDSDESFQAASARGVVSSAILFNFVKPWTWMQDIEPDRAENILQIAASVSTAEESGITEQEAMQRLDNLGKLSAREKLFFSSQLFINMPRDNRLAVAAALFDDAQEKGSTWNGLLDWAGFVGANPGVLLNLAAEQGAAIGAGGFGAGAVGSKIGTSIAERLASDVAKELAERTATAAGVNYGANVAASLAPEFAENLEETGDIEEAAGQAIKGSQAEGVGNMLWAFLPTPIAKTRLGKVGTTLAETAKQAAGGATGAGFSAAVQGKDITAGELLTEGLIEFGFAPIDLANQAIVRDKDIKQMGRLIQGANNKAKTQALLDAATETGLPEIDRGSLETIIQGMDDGQRNVYMDANQLFQTITPEQFSQMIPSVDRATIDQAIDVGADIRIPAAELISGVAGTEFEDAFTDHVRFDPSELSAFESNIQAPLAIDELKAEIDRLLARDQRKNTIEESGELVFKDITSQLQQADIPPSQADFIGELYRSRFITAAVENNTLPMDEYQQAFGGVVSQDLPGQTLNQLTERGQDATIRETEVQDATRTGPRSTAESRQGTITERAEQPGSELRTADTLEGASGRSDAEALAEFQRAANGERVTFLHRSDVDFSQFDDSRLGESTGTVTARMGHFLAAQDVGNAERYGASLTAWSFQLNNPIKLTADQFAELGLENEATIDAMREAFSATSDGIVVDGLNWAVVFRAETLQKAESAEAEQFLSDFTEPRELFQEKSDAVKAGAFNIDSKRIALLAESDLSTFLHETGHLFLEMQIDIASRPGASDRVKADMETVFKWFGVTQEEWANFDLDQKRPFHEKFAEGFEQYLFEGKSPSVELKQAFRAFKSWLKHVYKSMDRFLKNDLNDEVREVFDRMLATDEQIEIAQQEASLGPIFTSREEAGMSEQEWNDYMEPFREANEEAQEHMEGKSLRDMSIVRNFRNKQVRRLRKEAAGQRQDAMAEAETILMERPAYKAHKELSEKGKKLNLEALQEMYSDSGFEALGVGVKAGLVSKKGVHPDIAADLYGFESGAELIEALLSIDPKQDTEAMADQIMLERHGELASEEAIQQAADEAVHSMSRARAVTTELNIMARAQKQTRLPVSVAKDYAQGVIQKLKISQIRPHQYSVAESRAARQAQESLRRHQHSDALLHKRNQMLHNYTARAAHEAIAEFEKTKRLFSRIAKATTKKNVAKGRDPQVIDAINAIVSQYGVHPSKRQNALERLEVVRENNPEMFSHLEPVVRRTTAEAKPLKELTIDELRTLKTEVESLWMLAKRSTQIKIGEKLLNIEDAESQLLDRMAGLKQKRQIGKAHAVTKKEELGIKLQYAGSILRRVEQWAEARDGKFGGPFTNLIFQPVKQAADKYRADATKARKKYLSLIEKLPDMRRGTIEAPELGYTFGKGDQKVGMAELLHAILHTGNDSNKRKLLLGRGWAVEGPDGIIDTSRWDKFIARLQGEGVLVKEHYDFAQGVWDMLDSMKPLAQRAHQQVYGSFFDEVTANEFETPFGTYRGGYVPAQVDPRLTQDAALRDIMEEENQNMSFSFPSASRGFTKSRVEYNRPLMLDLRSISQHMDKVLIFSHMQPAVSDVNRLLRRRNVSSAISNIDPTAYDGMLIPWLNRAARQTVETPVPGDGGITRVLRIMRNRTGMALMMGNINNTFQQITGLSTAALKVKKRHLMRSTAQYMSAPREFSETVSELSPFMRNRMKNEIHAMTGTIEEILLDPTIFQKVENFTQRHAYFMQAAFDNVIGPIVWNGAYNDFIESGQGNHDQAIAFADSTVRNTQGSTLPEDVSRIETGPAFARIFTQFAGYFNMVANTNVTELQKIANDVGLKKGAGKAFQVLLYGLLIPAWVSEGIALAMRGGPEDEEHDGYLDDWLTEVVGLGTLKFTLATVPFVGQAANASINRFNNNPFDDRVSISPVVSLLETSLGAPHSVYKAIVDDGSKKKAIKDVATLMSVLTGLPAYPLSRPVGYLAEVADDRVYPTSNLDFARGVVTGTPSKDSR